MIGLLLAPLGIIFDLLTKFIIFILPRLDYVLVCGIVKLFLFGAEGITEQAPLYNIELHTVFVILIYVAAVTAWYGLQQITIKNIYVFKIAASAIASCLFTFLISYLASDGVFGKMVAEGLDSIWKWTIGIIFFGVVLYLRSQNHGLLYEPAVEPCESPAMTYTQPIVVYVPTPISHEPSVENDNPPIICNDYMVASANGENPSKKETPECIEGAS